MGITDRFDPVQSIQGGARYMGWLYGQYRAYDRTWLQRQRLALDSYFRGLGGTLDAQKRWGCVLWAPCFRHHAPPLTKDYVEDVSEIAGHPLAG